MVDYVLRNVDLKLWRKFKKRAADDGRSMRGVLLLLISRYVEHGLD